MSMLQQILDQMFVDPEILEALDEEQKQILFIKMREEQVKRWKIFEEKCESEGDPRIRVSRDNSRRIKWLKGEDGEVWVWVMGEHKDDLTIEQINEKRALEEARHLAEEEMLENMRLPELNADYVPYVGPNENENTLKEQLSRMKPLRGPDTSKNIQESMYEDADAMFESSSGEGTQWLLSSNSSSHRKLKGILKNRGDSTPKKNMLFETESQMVEYNQPYTELNANTVLNGSSTYNGSGSNLMSGASSPVGEAFVDLTSYTSLDVAADNVTIDSISQPLQTTYAARTQEQAEPTQDFSRLQTYVGCTENSSQMGLINVNTNGPTPLGLPYYSSNSASHHDIISRSSTSPLYGGVNFRVTPISISVTDIDGEISRRQSEIFEKLKEKQQQIDKEAEIEAERERQAWEMQEMRAREAEAQIRKIAQKAREQHRQQSLRTSSSIVPVLKDLNAFSLKEALKNLPRPPKPKSRAAIISWFKVEELQRGTGLDPKTLRPAVWFHGIISRDRADELLQDKPSGSYLVRVSERIWGYTVSYVVGDGKVKHFLIERIPQGYQFLGTNQIVHKHLHDLVAYHEVSPVTLKGNEILRWAVGQTDTLSPDYSDLIPS